MFVTLLGIITKISHLKLVYTLKTEISKKLWNVPRPEHHSKGMVHKWRRCLRNISEN